MENGCISSALESSNKSLTASLSHCSAELPWSKAAKQLTDLRDALTANREKNPFLFHFPPIWSGLVSNLVQELVKRKLILHIDSAYFRRTKIPRKIY